MSPEPRPRDRWTVGADAVVSLAWDGEPLSVPQGRLHAVGGEGLVAGRSVCLAPVALLDPAEWSWPDDGAEADDPLCWICLALTV
ncbi:hypothetical protein SAMN04488107_2272 [Geodermatophilus saharensis]|uniref:Uncharacterized protein n=1 Tax=Geodermatophilus saharensis TaxID=1137994 RepID=A0A239DQF9_9ACTN|nr:hypothetical protein [Geodermatophilus saharensis]SNS33834.1 hypothetical protein SAMN04488107_2272 [Geodermatophilus saharensis]